MSKQISVAERRFNTAAGVSVLGAFVCSRFFPLSGGLWGTGILFPLLSIATMKVGCNFFYAGADRSNETFKKWATLSNILFYVSLTLYTSTMITRDLIVHVVFLTLCLGSYFASLRAMRILHKQVLIQNSSTGSNSQKQDMETYIDILLGTTSEKLGETTPKLQSHAAESGWFYSLLPIIPMKHRWWLGFTLPIFSALFAASVFPGFLNFRATFFIFLSVLTRGIGGSLLHSLNSWTSASAGGSVFTFFHILGYITTISIPFISSFASDPAIGEIATNLVGLLSWILMISAVVNFDKGNNVVYSVRPSLLEYTWAWTTAAVPLIVAASLFAYSIIELGYQSSVGFFLSPAGNHILGSLLMCLPAFVLILGSIICGPIASAMVLFCPWFSGALVSAFSAFGWMLYFLSFTLFIRTSKVPDEIITQIVIGAGTLSWILFTLSVLFRHAQPRKAETIENRVPRPGIQQIQYASIGLVVASGIIGLFAWFSDSQVSAIYKTLAAPLVTSGVVAFAVLHQSLYHGVKNQDLFVRMLRILGWAVFSLSLLTGWISTACNFPGLLQIPQVYRNEVKLFCNATEEYKALSITGVFGFIAQLFLYLALSRSKSISKVVTIDKTNVHLETLSNRSRALSETSNQSEYSCDGSQCSECIRNLAKEENECDSDCSCLEDETMPDDVEPAGEPAPDRAKVTNDNMYIAERSMQSPLNEQPQVLDVNMESTSTFEENQVEIPEAYPESIRSENVTASLEDDVEEVDNRLQVELQEEINADVLDAPDSGSEKSESISEHSGSKSRSSSADASEDDSGFESDSDSGNVSDSSESSLSSISSTSSRRSSSSTVSELELLERAMDNPQGDGAEIHADGIISLASAVSSSSPSPSLSDSDEREGEGSSATPRTTVKKQPPKVPPRTYIFG